MVLEWIAGAGTGKNGECSEAERIISVISSRWTCRRFVRMWPGAPESISYCVPYVNHKILAKILALSVPIIKETVPDSVEIHSETTSIICC